MKTKELRELSAKELRKRVRDLRNEHFQLRMQHSSQQLEDTSRLKSTRREIAKIETLLNELQAQEVAS